VDVDESDGLSIWYDDHWVDTTRARVVIADASEFEMAHVRAPQPATSWSEGEIVADTNTTGLAPGSDAWVFVVTASGEVSPGVAVSIP
jgi:hypothetical protein